MLGPPSKGLPAKACNAGLLHAGLAVPTNPSEEQLACALESCHQCTQQMQALQGSGCLQGGLGSFSPSGSSLPVDSMTSKSKVPSAAFRATSCSTAAQVSQAPGSA